MSDQFTLLIERLRVERADFLRVIEGDRPWPSPRQPDDTTAL